MKKSLRYLLVALIMLSLSGCGAKESDSAYNLFTPNEGKELPLIIVFHGFGEADNANDTVTVSTLTSDAAQAKRPCYLMAPSIEDDVFLSESNRKELYEQLKKASDKLISDGKVDPEKVYVMGNSFGGLCTVEYMEEYPESVAAAIVMCPALTYSRNSTTALSKIKDIPVRFAHATNDNVIPVEVSRSAVSALNAMGSPDASLTEFTDQEMLAAGALTGFHQADFAVMADGSFAEWLFSH